MIPDMQTPMVVSPVSALRVILLREVAALLLNGEIGADLPVDVWRIFPRTESPTSEAPSPSRDKLYTPDWSPDMYGSIVHVSVYVCAKGGGQDKEEVEEIACSPWFVYYDTVPAFAWYCSESPRKITDESSRPLEFTFRQKLNST